MPSIRGIRRITVNFDPTEEQRQWRDLARDFAQGEIRPRAADLDREQKFPYDIVADMARLGLMGLTLPEEYGGSGGDFVAYNLALEEISRADTSVGITMEAHISLGCAPLATYGSREQKERFLSRCATGERLWAFGLTEEEAGTDAGGTRTTAELVDGEWIINGSKKWITNSGTDITAGVTAIARTGERENGGPELSAIIIPQETPGYTLVCWWAPCRTSWPPRSQPRRHHQVRALARSPPSPGDPGCSTPPNIPIATASGTRTTPSP